MTGYWSSCGTNLSHKNNFSLNFLVCFELNTNASTVATEKPTEMLGPITMLKQTSKSNET